MKIVDQDAEFETPRQERAATSGVTARWAFRPYCYPMLATDPLGWHDFEARTTKAGAGDYSIPAGGSLTLRYRLIFHPGDEKAAKIAERYADYAKGK